jgi:hypothetical protein
MKRCPTCNRAYEDDTLTFCLDDGARLSAPYGLQATLPVSAARDTDPPRTEILPSQPTPVYPAMTPRAFPSPGQADLTPRRGGAHWIIFGGTLAFIGIGLVILLGYIALKVSVKSASQPLSVPMTNSNRPGSKNKDTESPAWLEGVWEGRGYQSDTKTNWIVRLRVQDSRGAVDYPSIPCLGRWDLVENDAREAKFVEVITDGTNRCASNSNVTIQKIKDSQISCMYTYAGSSVVIATAILNQKAESTEQK